MQILRDVRKLLHRPSDTYLHTDAINPSRCFRSTYFIVICTQYLTFRSIKFPVDYFDKCHYELCKILFNSILHSTIRIDPCQVHILTFIDNVFEF